MLKASWTADGCSSPHCVDVTDGKVDRMPRTGLPRYLEEVKEEVDNVIL
jgi:hypothetical protein